MLEMLGLSLIGAPRVFLRTLPLTTVVAFIYFGLVTNVNDPLWRVVLILLLTTPCIAIVRLAALRSALITTGRTKPPTFQNLVRAQVRIAYANLLPINFVQVVIFTAVSALIVAELRPHFMAMVETAATGAPVQMPMELEQNLSRFVGAAGWLFALIAAAGFGVMGTAMAATAANAAEKSPRHDITYGLTFNFWKLTIVYFCAQTINAILVGLLAILGIAALGMSGPENWTYVLPVVVTIYLSLHFATTATAAALSYGALLDRDAAIREYVQQQVAGPQTSAEDLRALRHSRQH